MNWFIILFCILSILLYLITKYYLVNCDYKELKETEEIEAFETEQNRTIKDTLNVHHSITIKYLNKNEASNLININSEYMKNMNPSNLSARHCSSITELYEKYKTAFDDITPEEEEKINEFVLNLLNNIKRFNTSYYNYVSTWLKQISFAKGKYWLESGMPHTLDNTIIMDANWFSNPRKTTLLHELTHIHQRNVEFDFEDLYEELGYYYTPDYIKGLEVIMPLNRNNPDGLSKNWLWKMPKLNNTNTNNTNTNNTNTNNKDIFNSNNNNYWWIGAVFKSVNPSSLLDTDLLALKLDRDKEGNFYYLKQQPTLLSNLTSFIKFFGENPNNYHPNEMTAKFAEFYLLDILSDKQRNYDNYEGYKVYKHYFENMIKKYY